ncbi:MAG: hypothetical protein H6724_17070 [Sandaracinus sp.]|nr:hypothetical protein [Sandaracinus sp.]MCB9621154.1 hypothetical protein [Sandaracinus sp.]
MDEKISELLKLDPSRQADILANLSYEDSPREGLEDALAKLLPVKSPDLRREVLRCYAKFFPAAAVGVFVEQLGFVEHTGVLDGLGQLAEEHAPGLVGAGADALADALLAKRPTLDERRAFNFTVAAASVAPQRGAEWLLQIVRGGGAFATNAAGRLCEMGRADLAEAHLGALEAALESQDQGTRGGALEVIALLGPRARKLAPALAVLAKRLPNAYGLQKAIDAVGVGEVDTSSAFDAERVRALAKGKPSFDAWTELVRLLRAAPALDDGAWIAELEASLASWPAAMREVVESDLVSPDRWAPLFRSLTVANRSWSAKEVRALVDASVYPNLVRICLDGNRLGDEGVRVLLSAPWMHAVEVLSLAENRLSAAVAELFVQAKLTELQQLDLRFNDFVGADVPELAKLGLKSLRTESED